MSNRAPDLTEIVAAMIRSNRKTMYGGWLPGRIETYDSTKHKASVQLLLLEPRELETGEVKKEPVAIINDVPVVTMADHYGIRIELSLQKGDYVTVFFSSRSVDRWLQRGGMIDPDDERDHDLNDAMAMPGLFDFAHVTKPTARITFKQSTVEIGGTSNLVTRAEFLDHTHLTAPTGPVSPPTKISAPGVGGTAGYPGTQVLKGG